MTMRRSRLSAGCGRWIGLGATWLALGCSADSGEGGGQAASGGTVSGGSPSGGTTGGGGPSGGSTGAGITGGGPSSGSGGGLTGGATGSSGGSGAGTAGSCERPVGSCSSPQVTVTEIDLGVPITAYGNEGDTQPLPLAIASMPSGGSRLAALGTNGQIHIAELDCDDQLVGAFTIPGVNLQDLYADDEGGVVLLTREATNGGQDNCGNGQLCGGSSSPCRTMWLVRFNAAGAIQWETQVTNLSPTLAGYEDGARFVWWYQHHGRIAFDGGNNYAAYFCIGITVNNGACVDIHEGDRMQVVDRTGNLVSDHPDAFAVGCSHSWQTRIVWDPRVGRFVMVCATDNNCRIAQPSPYRTVAQGTCDGSLFGGDLVLSTTPGYWVAWSQGDQIRLEHFSGDDPSDLTITNAGASRHPHLVSYGQNHMLLAWGSGSGMTAQVRDAGSGDTVGAEFGIEVNDHDFQAFKAYADGSVAYPASGSSNTAVKIARVMPCN